MATDPPIACTESRVAGVQTLVLDLLTSDQSTLVCDLIEDLVRERDAGLVAFATLIEASEAYLRALQAEGEPTLDDVFTLARFEGLLADARRAS